MPIPRSNEAGDRGLIADILTGLEDACEQARKCLTEERAFRTFAEKPQMATPQNPNPPTAQQLIEQAEGYFHTALAHMNRVIAHAQNLQRAGMPAQEQPKPAASPAPALALAE